MRQSWCRGCESLSSFVVFSVCVCVTGTVQFTLCCELLVRRAVLQPAGRMISLLVDVMAKFAPVMRDLGRTPTWTLAAERPHAAWLPWHTSRRQIARNASDSQTESGERSPRGARRPKRRGVAAPPADRRTVHTNR